MNARQHRQVAGLVIHCPDWFSRTDFQAWLNAPGPRMTWHTRGKAPDEWGDVVVWVDPGLQGEGTNSDMPEDLWALILAACRDAGLHGQSEHIPVRLTNLVD